MRTTYAILDVPYDYDFENEATDHRIYASFTTSEIVEELIRMGADDKHYSIEIYRVDDDGDYYDGSDYDTPSNFIKRMREKHSRILQTCISEAGNYSDQDAYVSDLALSSIWGDDDEEIPEGRIEWLRQVWKAARRTVKDICKDAGMTQNATADHFCIPRRTFGNWCTGERECPVYTWLMMQELLGLFHR